MTEDELFDLLTWIEDMVPASEKAVRFEAETDALPEGEHGRAALLVAAGEHHQMRRAYADARRCFEDALADGGDVAGDIVADLFSLALDEGDEGEADRRLQELREQLKHAAISTSGCHHVGETLEIHDRPREAVRWFTVPLTWADDDDLDYLCLISRHRVRQALGLPVDRFDGLAREALDERGATNPA